MRPDGCGGPRWNSEAILDVLRYLFCMKTRCYDVYFVLFGDGSSQSLCLIIVMVLQFMVKWVRCFFISLLFKHLKHGLLTNSFVCNIIAINPPKKKTTDSPASDQAPAVESAMIAKVHVWHTHTLPIHINVHKHVRTMYMHDSYRICLFICNIHTISIYVYININSTLYLQSWILNIRPSWILNIRP